MSRNRSALALVLLALLALPLAGRWGRSAPAEDERQAGPALEALKKRLPDVVAKWSKDEAHFFRGGYRASLRSVRRTGPTEARVTIALEFQAKTEDGKRVAARDRVFAVLLQYYDGVWTAARFQAPWGAVDETWNSPVLFLMAAIDSEK